MKLFDFRLVVVLSLIQRFVPASLNASFFASSPTIKKSHGGIISLFCKFPILFLFINYQNQFRRTSNGNPNCLHLLLWLQLDFHIFFPVHFPVKTIQFWFQLHPHSGQLSRMRFPKLSPPWINCKISSLWSRENDFDKIIHLPIIQIHYLWIVIPKSE
jgi:hypothetical protein